MSGQPPHARSPAPDTVILIDTSFEDYSFADLESCWAELLCDTACPACRAVGEFAGHGWYTKYFYAPRIRILRVRCRRCRVTHALMPRFSLPGTSIGTAEAEKYLLARAEGLGRGGASAVSEHRGVSSRYAKQLDRMFATAVARAKALFPEAAEVRLPAMEWVYTVVGSKAAPLWSLNRFCLAHQYNCICFARASIIRFAPRSARTASSHNRGSPTWRAVRLRSWNHTRNPGAMHER